MVQGQVFLKGGGLAFFLFNFFKVYHFYIEKLLYKVIIKCRMQPTSADISSQHLMHPAVDDDLVICQNAHVDKCLCCQANIWCVLQLMMTLLNYFALYKIRKKSHSKLSKNEPENIP